MNADRRFVRGDIWSVDFGVDPEDPEQAFRCPALHVAVEPDDDTGLAVPTAFQAEQVRAVSIVRLVERRGCLDPVSRHAIEEILRNALGL